MNTEILAGIITLLLYTVGDLLIKKPSEHAGSIPSSLMASMASAAVLVIMAAFSGLWIPGMSLLFSAITGVLMGAGMLLVLKSLESEQVSDTMAMVSISYAIPVIFGAVALREAVSSLSWLGIALVFAGSAIIAFKEMKLNRALIPAVIGNSLWGFQFITFDYALRYSDNFLAIAAAGSVIGLFIVFTYASIKSRINIDTVHRLEAAFAGISMGLGLAGALYLVLNNTVTLGLSIVAAEPALITLLGKIIFKDKINLPQITGITIAIAGILLLTAPGI